MARYIAAMLEAGDVASILVTFIEERNGKALVRLPNGSKTSLPFECLDLLVRGEDLPRVPVRDDLTSGPLLAPYRRRPLDELE
jgi:hypothetical protein